MNKLHRSAVLLAAASVTALALTSCSPGSSDPGSSGAATGDPASPVEITVQSFSDQPAAIAATKEIVDAFNADNPGISVKIVQAPTDSLDDKLTTQFVGGVAPDIIHYEVLGIVPFA